MKENLCWQMWKRKYIKSIERIKYKWMVLLSSYIVSFLYRTSSSFNSSLSKLFDVFLDELSPPQVCISKLKNESVFLCFCLYNCTRYNSHQSFPSYLAYLQAKKAKASRLLTNFKLVKQKKVPTCHDQLQQLYKRGR